MVILRFKSKESHAELLKKVKKMEKLSSELSDVLEECMYDEDYDDEYETEYRGGGTSMRRGSRYAYRRY